MNINKIILSLVVIGAVSAIAVGGTVAYFSDTETSTGNTFSAGTIDIAVTSPANWQYAITDMKPGYVDYSNFIVKNTGDNPVNIWKKVSNVVTGGGAHPESEEAADPSDTINNIDTVITYDLSVEVKDLGGNVYWSQTLYNNEMTIAQINALGGNGTFLGMLPVGYTMEVTESYHMLTTAGNEYQGDNMTFDITLTGEQLTGTLVLEDKDTTNWQILSANAQIATLTYAVKGDTFDYTLTGVSPIISGNVALVAGYDSNTNPDTLIGYGTTDASGNITMNNDSVELGKDLIGAKIWLIPQGDWDDANKQVIGWHMSQYLWETGLVDYYDTNN